MNDTEKVRQILREWNGTFSLHDFKKLNIPNISSILNKLESKGEIRQVDSIYRKGGRAIKVFQVVKLVNLSPKELALANKRSDAVRRKPASTIKSLWENVYPEFFRIPEFRIIGKMIHKPID